MFNIFSFICICLNFTLYSNIFFLRQIARGLCLFQSNRRNYAGYTFILFSIILVWQATVSFR